jgi:hypothetical protein
MGEERVRFEYLQMLSPIYSLNYSPFYGELLTMHISH